MNTDIGMIVALSETYIICCIPYLSDVIFCADWSLPCL